MRLKRPPRPDPFEIDLDKLSIQVAQFALGHVVYDDEEWGIRYWESSGGTQSALRPYSTDIKAAWDVLRAIEKDETPVLPQEWATIKTTLKAGLIFGLKSEDAAMVLCATILGVLDESSRRAWNEN